MPRTHQRGDGDALILPRPADLTGIQRRRAAQAVAVRAAGVEECAEVLAMLGLTDKQRRPVGWTR